jgi:ABC-type sugar transport system substrate-binding protein
MKKITKVVVSLVCVLALVLLAVGCGSQAPAASSAAPAASSAAPAASSAAPAASSAAPAASSAAAGPITIGISMGASQSTFCQGLQDGATNEVKKLGATPIVSLADNKVDVQANQIQDMVAKGAKAVIVFAADTDAITASAKYCKDHGVAFIEASRISPDLTNIDLAIGFSNKQQAEICGQAIVDGSKAASFTTMKTIEFIGDLADQNAKERQQYFEAFAKTNNISIVGTVLTEWDAEKAVSRYKDTITAVNDDYNSMYCASDFLFTPIMSVLTEKGQWVKQGEKGYHVIVGIDGAPDALQKIRDGYCYMDANTDVMQLGLMAADKAVDIITKGTKYTGADKTVMIDAQSITAANASDPKIWGNNYKA